MSQTEFVSDFIKIGPRNPDNKLVRSGILQNASAPSNGLDSHGLMSILDIYLVDILRV